MMISDVINDCCDISILVSADSDLIPPIEFIKEYKSNHKIFIYFPPNRESYSLKRLGHSYIKLERHQDKFKSSLLANEIEDTKTHYIIKRPANWV